MQAGVGLLDRDVMLICIIIGLDIVITLRFSINWSTVICSPTVLFAILREASSETYGPRVYFPSHKFSFYYFAIFYFQIYKPKKPKNIYFIFCLVLSISMRCHFCKWPWRDWQPLYHVGCKCLIVCVGASIGDLCVSPTGLIPWFLTEGNTYLYCATSPFPLQGKNQRKLKK